MKAPPPRPELCGSTRPSTAWTATAAATAEPPPPSTLIAAWVARGLAAAAITRGPAVASARLAEAGLAETEDGEDEGGATAQPARVSASRKGAMRGMKNPTNTNPGEAGLG